MTSPSIIDALADFLRSASVRPSLFTADISRRTPRTTSRPVARGDLTGSIAQILSAAAVGSATDRLEWHLEHLPTEQPQHRKLPEEVVLTALRKGLPEHADISLAHLPVRMTPAKVFAMLKAGIESDSPETVRRILGAYRPSPEVVFRALFEVAPRCFPRTLSILSGITREGLFALTLRFVRANQVGCVEILLGKGIDVHFDEEILLIRAVRFGSPQLVELLLRFGADPSRNDFRASYVAIIRHRPENLSVVLAANPNFPPDHIGIAINSGTQQSLEILCQTYNSSTPSLGRQAAFQIQVQLWFEYCVSHGMAGKLDILAEYFEDVANSEMFADISRMFGKPTFNSALLPIIFKRVNLDELNPVSRINFLANCANALNPAIWEMTKELPYPSAGDDAVELGNQLITLNMIRGLQRLQSIGWRLPPASVLYLAKPEFRDAVLRE